MGKVPESLVAGSANVGLGSASAPVPPPVGPSGSLAHEASAAPTTASPVICRNSRRVDGLDVGITHTSSAERRYSPWPAQIQGASTFEADTQCCFTCLEGL